MFDFDVVTGPTPLRGPAKEEEPRVPADAEPPGTDGPQTWGGAAPEARRRGVRHRGW